MEVVAVDLVAAEAMPAIKAEDVAASASLEMSVHGISLLLKLCWNE
jgi:hypothetical protein